MTTETRPRGRPRDETIDEEIRRAVFDLVEEVGLAGLTIDGIAERAGVSKATIYRRWESKDQLCAHAIAGLANSVKMPESNDIREVLLATLRRMDAFLTSTTAGTVFPWLIGEVAAGSEMGHHYAEAVILPGRRAMAARISAAIEDGQLRSDLDIDVAVDMIMGPAMVRRLLGLHRQEERGWDERVVDTLLSGWMGDARS